MTDCRPGDMVEIWEGGAIVTAVLLGQEKGRWRIVTETGRSMKITGSRIAHRAGRAPAEPGQGAAAAAAHSREASALAESIDVASLWELLVDEGGRHSPDALSGLALGDATAAAASAVIRRLSREKTFFDRKGEDWVARSREAVEETRRRHRIETERAARKEAFLQRMRARMDGTAAGPPDPEDRSFLDKIIDLAVHGDESVTRKDAVALMADLGASGPMAGMAAFDLLVKLGLFQRDENLEILRFGLRTAFPPEVLQAAERAVAGTPRSPARTFPDLTVLALDDPGTAEVDDGLSLEDGEEGLSVVGIHIADPTVFTGPGDLLDEEALNRAATYYFPDRRLNMLPPAISEQAASLQVGEERPAVSFFLHVDGEGQVRKFEIVPSKITTTARMSYEEADAVLQEGAECPSAVRRTLERLAAVAERMRGKRLEAGAVIIRSPEVSVKVGEGGGIVLKVSSERGISRDLVAEMMIQANAHSAGFCATHGVPAIYRRQAPPESPPEPVPDGPYDPVAMRAARRGLRRGEVGLAPDVHYALGVPAYMQITSPLRRYQDLAALRQVKAWLVGEPFPYDSEALSRIAATTEAAEKAARQAENAASTYWVLRYLEGWKGREVDGVIIHVEARRSAVELIDTLHVAGIAARPDHRPGDRVRLVIEEVRPRLGSIRLRQVDRVPTGEPSAES